MSDNPTEITLDSFVVRSADVLDAEVDGEVVALDVEQGNCYGLNSVAGDVWRAIATPQRVGDICARLVTEYAIDAQTCETEILGLLTELRAERLVSLVDAPQP